MGLECSPGSVAPPSRELKLKICIVGPPAAGKSSLTRRFVYGSFSESYVTTLGANMAKRVVNVAPPEGGEKWSVTMVVWDIMGQRTFLDLLIGAYFQGTHGVLAVADLTRPETFAEVALWIGAVKDVAGDELPVVLLGNKVDLVDRRNTDFFVLEATAKAHGTTLRFTSAKTGEQVEEAFLEIGSKGLANYLASAKPTGTLTA